MPERGSARDAFAAVESGSRGVQLPHYARQFNVRWSKQEHSELGGPVKNEQRVAAYKRQGNRKELAGRQKRRVARKARQGEG